jgi:hypothetical protein
MNRIVSGASVIMYVNGRPFANVIDFKWRHMTPGEEIGGLDSMEAFEIAPTTSRISGTLNLYRLMGDGGLEGAGIVPTAEWLPRGKYFSLALVERLTDTVIFSAQHCHSEDQGWDVQTRKFVMGSMSFKALSYSNEARQRI